MGAIVGPAPIDKYALTLKIAKFDEDLCPIGWPPTLKGGYVPMYVPF